MERRLKNWIANAGTATGRTATLGKQLGAMPSCDLDNIGRHSARRTCRCSVLNKTTQVTGGEAMRGQMETSRRTSRHVHFAGTKWVCRKCGSRGDKFSYSEQTVKNTSLHRTQRTYFRGAGGAGFLKFPRAGASRCEEFETMKVLTSPPVSVATGAGSLHYFVVAFLVWRCGWRRCREVCGRSPCLPLRRRWAALQQTIVSV